MEMILVDWTRMGKVYCLAGAVAENGAWRFVRPLQLKHKDGPARNSGWSPYLLDNHHCRWEVFELVGAQPATLEPPHLEDLWVLGIRSRKIMATPAQRRAVLAAGVRPAGHPAFGERLLRTWASAYLPPGRGDRSLATIPVPREQIAFRCVQRAGVPEFDCRASLGVPGLEGCTLPVKDHFLLRGAEAAGPEPATRERELAHLVGQMGETVAVRLGLSREFSTGAARHCWLMADGFFSFTDPQP